ncbi:MAG: divalent-cation tolerance protein CutA [Candidatus Bathyarchaeia archaeon]
MKEYIQIITTTDTKESAEKIADMLVKNRLAACVQIIGPIASVYWWKGKIEKFAEWLCIIKTRRDLYKDIESSIRRKHTYEIPEILAVPVIEGNESYILWLSKELRK